MGMTEVTVIAAQGAVLTGPLRIAITPEQHATRQAILGPWAEDGVFDIDGGRRLSFKKGEVLGVEMPEGRLNPLLFAWEEAGEPPDDAKPDGEPPDDAKADGAAADDAKADAANPDDAKAEAAKPAAAKPAKPPAQKKPAGGS